MINATKWINTTMQWVEYLDPSDMRYYRHMFGILHNGSLLKKRASTVSQDKHKNF